jgi:hypothetical protein
MLRDLAALQPEKEQIRHNFEISLLNSLFSVVHRALPDLQRVNHWYFITVSSVQ